MFTIKDILKTKILFFVVLIIFLIVTTIYFFSKTTVFSSELKDKDISLESLRTDNAKVKNEIHNVKKEYTKLTQDYADLKNELEKVGADRANLTRRIKALLSDSNLARTLEDKFEKVSKEKELLVTANKDLIENNLSLKAQVDDLETIKSQLVKDKRELEEALDKEKQKSELTRLREENDFLRSENDKLNSDFKKLDTELANLKLNNRQLSEEAKQIKENSATIEKDYQELVKKNKLLENRLIDLPSEYTKIAQQNKSLIRNTANMHYNMGVFYSRQKDYRLAAVEFKKNLELVPDDAQAHFNLGYIYAEHLANRKEAIRHFRQYLRYAKKGDKDIDWVKKYLVAWQVWDGNDPVQ